MSSNPQCAENSATKQEMFRHSFCLGLVIAFLPFTLFEIFNGDNANDALVSAPIILVLWAFAVIRQLRKQRSPLLQVAGITAGVALLTLIILTQASNKVENQYRSLPQVADFALLDFDRLETPSGALSSTQIKAVLDLDKALKAAGESLSMAEQFADQAPLRQYDRDWLKSEIQVHKKMADVSEDMIDRLAAVQAIACYAGRQMSTDECMVTKSDLMGFKGKLENKYPVWLFILRHLNRLP